MVTDDRWEAMAVTATDRARNCDTTTEHIAWMTEKEVSYFRQVFSNSILLKSRLIFSIGTDDCIKPRFNFARTLNKPENGLGSQKLTSIWVISCRDWVDKNLDAKVEFTGDPSIQELYRTNEFLRYSKLAERNDPGGRWLVHVRNQTKLNQLRLTDEPEKICDKVC
jgi:hypothetical protein